ncbi:MAG: SUKH-4 family immunity protein [Desulfobacteraceae bacterium]|nr:SUKH-4 family immunity protein [Desulfobacteraceae bacterium]
MRIVLPASEEFWSDFEHASIRFYRRESLCDLDIPENEKEFLEVVGLPDSAATFLCFEKNVNEKLKSVSEIWNLSEEFERYKVIGFNGSGESIAVDSTNGEVSYFNHDDGFKKVMMNTSVTCLAECLAKFMWLVIETEKENGNDAVLNNDFPKHLQEQFKIELESIDSKALEGNTFWNEQINQMAEGPW